MNKGLKALEELSNHVDSDYFRQLYKLIETELKRLEDYDFMFHNNELCLTKEKEALKRTDAFRMGTDSVFNKSGYNFDDYHKDMNTLRKALDTLETLRQMRNDKQDEILRIIKEKRVDILLIGSSRNVGFYNLHRPLGTKQLLAKEFNLLKEYLQKGEKK